MEVGAAARQPSDPAQSRRPPRVGLQCAARFPPALAASRAVGMADPLIFKKKGIGDKFGSRNAAFSLSGQRCRPQERSHLTRQGATRILRSFPRVCSHAISIGRRLAVTAILQKRSLLCPWEGARTLRYFQTEVARRKPGPPIEAACTGYEESIARMLLIWFELGDSTVSV